MPQKQYLNILYNGESQSHINGLYLLIDASDSLYVQYLVSCLKLQKFKLINLT